MVTDQEFQEALKIVNQYIYQLNINIESKENKLKDFDKTDILKWIEQKRKELPKVTNNHTRLFNVLKMLHISNPYGRGELKYIEEAIEYKINRCRNSSINIEKLFNDLYYNHS